MHELTLCQAIVDQAVERAAPARVVRVRLKIGRLSAVVHDAMRFCFDLCTVDTLAAGAILEIIEVPGRGRCRVCSTEVEMSGPVGSCPCGSVDLEWLSGDDVLLSEIEVV